MATGWEFTKIFNWDGVGTASGDYTDVTLEAQSPAGTSFTIFNTAAHYLYLGHSEKFDMAVFDLDSTGSLGALTWQYYSTTASEWVTFVPGSGRFQVDPDDSEGSQYSFAQDGIEMFPINLLTGWGATTINTISSYWIRVTAATVANAPTVKRIQMRAYNSYCSTNEVFRLLQLNNVLGGTDFSTSSIPSKASVEDYINEAQSYIDMNTRKSWRPNYIAEEYHEFNLNGFKLDRPDPYKIISTDIWSGSGWEAKRQGRSKDYFLVPSTGMVQFSRYFLLPARFTSYNAPVWRWGGGEFTMPIKAEYLCGKDLNTDVREAGIVEDVCKKMAAIEVMRTADFGNVAVSGMDRVMQSERINQWQMEIEDRLDFLKAFEAF